MFIRFYDPDTLDEAGRIEAFYSFTWTRRFDKPGSFQLVLPLTAENLRLSRLNRYIWFRGGDAGVIEGRVASTDDRERGPTITLTGRSLSALLDRRVIPDVDSDRLPGTVRRRENGEQHDDYIGGADAVAYALVRLCSPIPRLVVPKGQTLARLSVDELHDSETGNAFQDGDNLLADIQKIADLKGLGYRVRAEFDQKRLVFELYKRRIRTAGTTRQAVFSERDGDILETVRTETTLNACTMEFVSHEYSIQYSSEIDTQKYASMQHWGKPGNLFPSGLYANGILLRSIGPATSPLHCQGAHDGEVAKYPSVTLADQDYCDSRFREKLDGLELTLNGLSRNVVYLRDYDVGDRVTVRKESWGLTAELDITEAQEIYDEDGPRVSLTVGRISGTRFSVPSRRAPVLHGQTYNLRTKATVQYLD